MSYICVFVSIFGNDVKISRGISTKVSILPQLNEEFEAVAEFGCTEKNIRNIFLERNSD